MRSGDGLALWVEHLASHHHNARWRRLRIGRGGSLLLSVCRRRRQRRGCLGGGILWRSVAVSEPPALTASIAMASTATPKVPLAKPVANPLSTSVETPVGIDATVVPLASVDQAHWIVDNTKAAGNAADPTSWDSAAATAPEVTATPSRRSRRRRSSRPRESRAATVPSGQPSWSAASRIVLPSR